MIAMKIGGTMPSSLTLKLPMFARNFSSSKRLITIEVWPDLRGVVWATICV